MIRIGADAIGVEGILETDLVLVHKPLPALAVVTLNRPAAMNALSSPLCRRLDAVMADLAASDTRVVILTGSGKAFCAGVDLKEVGEGRNENMGRTVIKKIESFPGIVIGAINGVAVTGGFELALACDVLVAAETTRFGDTHALVGFLPDWGLSQKLSRLVGPYRAKAISMTGRYVGAQEAQGLGIVTSVVPAERLMEAAMELAKSMLAAQPGILEAMKRLIDDGYDMSFADAKEMEHERAMALNRAVTPEIISSRRQNVLAHGRQQATGDAS